MTGNKIKEEKEAFEEKKKIEKRTNNNKQEMKC